MSLYIVRALGLVILLQSISATGIAATPEETANRQAEELQRKNQLQLQQQYEQDRKSARKPLHIEVTPPESKEVVPGQQCWQIKQVQFEGISLLPADQVTDLQSRYSDRCIGVIEIENLLSELTALYMAEGYITVRAYLPQQDLSSGLLRILVIEGQVEGFRIEGDADSISLGNVAPGIQGRPFNLRDLEQALDQINRLASNNASFAIEPGNNTGDSIILINNQPGKPWHLGLSYDNRGSEPTGKKQLGLNLGLDNPLGFNDYLALTHRRALPYQSNEQASYSNSLTYVLPYGYHTFTLGLNNSTYDSLLAAPSGADLFTDGMSKQASLRWDYLAYRDQTDRVTLSATLTGKESKNYLENVLLKVSSRRLSMLDVQINMDTRLAGGSFNWTLGYSQGLKLLGALEDPDNLPALAPHAQFSKLNLSAGYSRPFQLGEQNFIWSSSFTGQYADDVLYGSEQISIGGLYTVRGFENNSLAGDHGFYLRNELSWFVPFQLGSQPALLRPYLAFDYGRIDNILPDSPDGVMSGAALGLSLAGGPLSLDIFYADKLHQPASMEDEGGVIYFLLNLSL